MEPSAVDGDTSAVGEAWCKGGEAWGIGRGR